MKIGFQALESRTSRVDLLTPFSLRGSRPPGKRIFDMNCQEVRKTIEDF
jgi:hypothetical protein